MKKFTRILLVLLMTLILSGCFQKSEFEKALEHFEEADSVTISMTMKAIPYIGDFVVLMEFDEDKTRIDTMGEIIYTFERDDEVYSITQNTYGTWIEEIMEDSESTSEDFFTTGGIDEDDFEFIDGWYVSKTDVDNLFDVDELKDFRMKITDDKITHIDFVMEIEGMSIVVEIEFTEYNNTSVTLPN